jgi:hypothetical protein
MSWQTRFRPWKKRMRSKEESSRVIMDDMGNK